MAFEFKLPYRIAFAAESLLDHQGLMEIPNQLLAPYLAFSTLAHIADQSASADVKSTAYHLRRRLLKLAGQTKTIQYFPFQTSLQQHSDRTIITLIPGIDSVFPKTPIISSFLSDHKLVIARGGQNSKTIYYQTADKNLTPSDCLSIAFNVAMSKINLSPGNASHPDPIILLLREFAAPPLITTG